MDRLTGGCSYRPALLPEDWNHRKRRRAARPAVTQMAEAQHHTPCQTPAAVALRAQCSAALPIHPESPRASACPAGWAAEALSKDDSRNVRAPSASHLLRPVRLSECDAF